MRLRLGLAFGLGLGLRFGFGLGIRLGLGLDSGPGAHRSEGSLVEGGRAPAAEQAA